MPWIKPGDCKESLMKGLLTECATRTRVCQVQGREWDSQPSVQTQPSRGSQQGRVGMEPLSPPTCVPTCCQALHQPKPVSSQELDGHPGAKSRVREDREGSGMPDGDVSSLGKGEGTLLEICLNRHPWGCGSFLDQQG